MFSVVSKNTESVKFTPENLNARCQRLAVTIFGQNFEENVVKLKKCLGTS